MLRPHTPPHPPTNLVTITPAHLALPPTQRCRNQLPNSTIKCRHYTMDCSSKPRITQAELRVLYRPPLLHFLKRPHCGLWTALKPLEYTACLLSERNKTQKHSMPRRVCDGVKCYIYSCQRLMLSATILHGPNLHAHSAPTQFYSRTT